MSLFEPLVPGLVRVAETREDLTDRDSQFAAGRRLVAELVGGPHVDVPRGARGAPMWPTGVVGSITHTRRYAAVAVAASVDAVSIGIDAEPIMPLAAETIAVVTNSAELVRITPACGELAGLVAFVAKEAVFKAWWPVHGRELDFSEVALSVGGPGLLVARHPEGEWDVRWAVAEGMALAAVVVRHG